MGTIWRWSMSSWTNSRMTIPPSIRKNAALKAKMKVLVEKVEDYRATEDSMRATLLTAQKMADSIVHEAETKRDEILAQAQADAKARIGGAPSGAGGGRGALRQGQLDLARFIAASRQICQQELELLERLPDLQVEVAAVPTGAGSGRGDRRAGPLWL